MHDPNMSQKSRGVVVNHAGLWICVVAMLWATERRKPATAVRIRTGLLYAAVPLGVTQLSCGVLDSPHAFLFSN